MGQVMTTAKTSGNSAEARVLRSYLGGKWQAGAGRGTALVNPTDGTTLAWASSAGLDLGAGLDHARRVGGPSLRTLGYAQRAELLGKIADLLTAQRERWYEIARRNSGNTKADATIDIEGSIGTLKYFSRLGAKLGDARMLADGA